MTDQEFMRRAVRLAKNGTGWVNPNPLVGAVIVREGRIIGEGWHRRCGGLHAEREAFASLTESAEGATMYVTLEPCCHYGKQPPCTLAIIEHGIRRVVVGSRDPNPLVAGKGVSMLRENGISVEEDFLREECDALNPVFFHYITTKRPYVKMKYAMTADGKIATKTGASRWITGEKAREKVHEWRHACMGIMAGIGTVLADDPMLNCRIPGGKDPVRIVCDSRLRLPEDSQILRSAGEIPTIVVCGFPELPGGRVDPAGLRAGRTADSPRENGAAGTGKEDDRKEDSGKENFEKGDFEKENPGKEDFRRKASRLMGAGVSLINMPAENGRGIDLRGLMEILGAEGIDSILLEGGGTLNESALREGIVNEVDVFVAPKIFGGTARSPVEGEGVEEPARALPLHMISTEMFGEDLLIRYRVGPVL